MLAEVSELSWDFLCFSETRAADADFLLEGGHRLICSRGEVKHSGVAILVNSRWTGQIKKVGAISDRMLYVDVVMHNHKYRIIATYWPHARYPSASFNSCVDNLRGTILDSLSLDLKPIWAGDLNAEINRGSRGTRFQEVLAETGTMVCNDITELPFDKAWTFRSCLGVKRTLDYVCAPVSLSVSSAEAIEHLDLGSDHRAVVAQISIPDGGSSRPLPSKQLHINWAEFERKAEKCFTTNPPPTLINLRARGLI